MASSLLLFEEYIRSAQTLVDVGHASTAYVCASQDLPLPSITLSELADLLQKIIQAKSNVALLEADAHDALRKTHSYRRFPAKFKAVLDAREHLNKLILQAGDLKTCIMVPLYMDHEKLFTF